MSGQQIHKTRFSIHLLSLLILASSAFALSSGCSGASSEPLQLSVSTGLGGVLRQGEALVFSASGLNPGEYPVLIQALTQAGSVASQVKLTADELGRISNVILSYDVGFFSSAGSGLLSPGDYTIRLTSSAGTVESKITIPDTIDKPTVWGCDIDGNLSNSFLAGNPVFATAVGLEPDTGYRIMAVADRRAWHNGDSIKSWQSGYPSVVWPAEIPEYIEVTTNSDGEISPVQILPFATKFLPGVTDQFDIVVDGGQFGVFETGIDAVDGNIPTGAVVQEAHPGGPIYAQLASRSNYTYTNTFKRGDDISIWLNPGVILSEFSSYVLKYIIIHTDNWVDGMTLEDITGFAELDPIQIGCINEAIILVWVDALPGEYDVLLDVNANGIYDEGIDVLDGGPDGPGFTVTASD